MSYNVTAARRRLIDDYRRGHGDAMGLTDHQVEGLAYGLEDTSTEALSAELSRRGYIVSLEVGGR